MRCECGHLIASSRPIRVRCRCGQFVDVDAQPMASSSLGRRLIQANRELFRDCRPCRLHDLVAAVDHFGLQRSIEKVKTLSRMAGIDADQLRDALELFT